jgi:hypothetical protein
MWKGDVSCPTGGASSQINRWQASRCQGNRQSWSFFQSCSLPNRSNFCIASHGPTGHPPTHDDRLPALDVLIRIMPRKETPPARDPNQECLSLHSDRFNLGDKPCDFVCQKRGDNVENGVTESADTFIMSLRSGNCTNFPLFAI